MKRFHLFLVNVNIFAVEVISYRPYNISSKTSLQALIEICLIAICHMINRYVFIVKIPNYLCTYANERVIRLNSNQQ